MDRALRLGMQAEHVRALCEVLYRSGRAACAGCASPDADRGLEQPRRSDVTYRYSEAFLFFGGVHGPNISTGRAASFAAFIRSTQTWTHGAVGDRVQRTSGGCTSTITAWPIPRWNIGNLAVVRGLSIVKPMHSPERMGF
ncbi:MAG: hypothetical protein IPK17_00475 [Chloroflexi bacterium]|uniref:hypothetical protein n=1 Tax=Candidatus Flexifilum breve TaxID=3140694 RepID=UPI003134CA45|nr:hypothetical protein [Chloroflexota bacterium]